MIATTFILFSLLGVSQAGRNNWRSPCLFGTCYYDLPARPGEIAPSGTLKVWGPADSITDITEAAGWQVLDCNKEDKSQSIRLVCTGDERNCNHLFRSIGPVGKLARLPEDCSPAAFAHISRSWEPDDQTLPANVERRLSKRGPRPSVRALHIDTDFASADPLKFGIISFSIQAANVPGADAEPLPHNEDEETISVTTESDDTPADPEVTLAFVQRAVAANFALSTPRDSEASDNRELTFVNSSTPLGPWSIDKTYNLLNETLTCSSTSAHLKIDVTANASALAGVAVVAQGTIIPPVITYIHVTATLTAEVDGALILDAGLVGSVDSGKKTLWERDIPGLDFAGLVTVTPSLAIYSQAIANMNVNAAVNLGLKYSIREATFSFPPRFTDGGVFKLGDMPLGLSVSPTARASGTTTAHLIPQLSLSLNSFDGLSTAVTYISLDAHATANLALHGSVVASNGHSAEEVASATPESDEETRGVTANWSGCFEILAGLDAKAGASAHFFNLFNGSRDITLFNKNWQLLRKCYGRSARRSLWDAHSYMERAFFEKRALACPSTKQPDLVPVVSQAIISSG